MAYNGRGAGKKIDGRRSPQPWTRQHIKELRGHSRARTPVANFEIDETDTRRITSEGISTWFGARTSSIVRPGNQRR
jgi:hypothetical protein